MTTTQTELASRQKHTRAIRAIVKQLRKESDRWYNYFSQMKGSRDAWQDLYAESQKSEAKLREQAEKTKNVAEAARAWVALMQYPSPSRSFFDEKTAIVRLVQAVDAEFSQAERLQILLSKIRTEGK